MRKLLLGFLVLLCLPLSSIAQESVGFSNPDNIQPLLDYRLPEWGYSNFYLDFSTDGLFNKTEYNSQGYSKSENQFTGQLAPNYIYYLESEPRISNYFLRSELDFSSTERNSLDEEKNSDKNFQVSLQWNLSEKIYPTDSDLFLIGNFSGLLYQESQNLENITSNGIDTKSSDLRRNFRPMLEIGIGFGRLRNVNPMIRALRMNERLNALNTEPLGRQDIISAAEHLTRLSGYQQKYDRPQKYFWGNMNDVLSINLTTLTPFDLLYLTDITKETIGLRREGWQVYGVLGLDHSISYKKEKKELNGTSSSNLSKTTYFRPRVEGIWSKNISLKHQIGFTGSFLHSRELTENRFNNNSNVLNSSVNWIYTVTDRILINTSLSYLKIGFESSDPDILTVGTKIDYFLENKFSLFADVQAVGNWQSTRIDVNNSETKSFQRVFNFSAGLRYYFKRELF